MRKIRYMSIVLLLTLIGCENRGYKGDVKIVDEISCNTQTQVVCKDSLSIEQNFNLWNMKIENDIAVLRTSGNKDFIKVYSYPDFSPLYDFGETGRGSDEFITHNWCCSKLKGKISLYDIMKRSLYVFEVNRDTVTEVCSYKLEDNEDGLCRPYTKMLQLSESVFLMKEDFSQTVLHLADLDKKKELSAYISDFRKANDRKNGGYTPFDCCFAATNDRVLLCYNYVDRMELLQITGERHLTPLVFMGDGKASDIDTDKYLTVCTNNKRFYCLKCTDGVERGNEVLCIDIDGNICEMIKLDKDVSLIQFDADGNLVAYSEKEQGGMFYIYDKADFE